MKYNFWKPFGKNLMVYLGILMQQLVQNHPEIMAEMMKKVPLDIDQNFPEKQEFISLMCKKLGKFTCFRIFKYA